MKDGDWICKCGEHNFRSRAECRKCKQLKSGTTENQSLFLTKQPEAETSSNKKECIVCMDKTANSVIAVCGHLAMCVECALKLDSCPICRTNYSMEQVVKVYDATN
eukprot:TRINITY_DN5488_c1_g1_i1.p1 TRINITY_DN5488_c1_g1~~TRINITY_DN5488_c1_g1_i1.p1  ORF type:complete len:106 (+),score=10.65 TRINITY_DN5488_c1_g1_i1:207-524(+)